MLLRRHNSHWIILITLILTTMKQRLIEQYAPLIGQFLDSIKGIDASGIPAPHIPIMGQSYEDAKYKMAFLGMETYGWTDINEFCEIARKNLEEAVTYDENTINSLEYLNWASNYTSTFWGFVLKFLAKFYNILDFNRFIGDNKTKTYKDILTSFVWGETNSIERYHVSLHRRFGRRLKEVAFALIRSTI